MHKDTSPSIGWFKTHKVKLKKYLIHSFIIYLIIIIINLYFSVIQFRTNDLESMQEIVIEKNRIIELILTEEKIENKEIENQRGELS